MFLHIFWGKYMRYDVLELYWYNREMNVIDVSLDSGSFYNYIPHFSGEGSN